MSEKVGSGNDTIFGGGCRACFRPRIQTESATKVLSITSGQPSVKTKLNLWIPVRTVTVVRGERETGRKEDPVNSRRGALLPRSCLLSTGDNQREVSSRDAFTIVFRHRSHATSVWRANRVNTDTTRAVYTRMLFNFDRGESVFNLDRKCIEMHALSPPGDGKMVKWRDGPFRIFYSPRCDPRGLVSSAIDIYAYPLHIMVTSAISLILGPDSPALDNRYHLRFKWHPKIVSAECARIRILWEYHTK